MVDAVMSKVMWSLEDSRQNYAADVDTVLRGEAAGYNARVVGNVRELFPRLSRRDYEAYKFSRMQSVPGAVEALISGMGPAKDKVWNTITGSRRVVEQTLEDGSRRYVVVPVAEVAETEVELLERELGYVRTDEMVLPSDVELAARKQKTITLSQVFADADAVNKYSLPRRVFETAKRMSISSPGTAARYVQTYVNCSQQVVHLRVTHDRAAFDTSLACNTLRTVGECYRRDQVSVQSELIGDTLYLFGPGGVDDWHVSGPLRRAVEVAHVYWIMHHAGRVFPNVLFSMELVVLDINVYDGQSCMEPEVTFHAGDGFDLTHRGLSTAVTRDMTAAQRAQLQSLAGRMKLVSSADGVQLGTAVQVTGKHAVMNAHVLMVDPQCTIDGVPVQVKSQLSRDVFAVASSLDFSPWLLRDPVVGEWVAICYLVGTELSCSEPLQIVSVAADTIVTTMDPLVGPGVSGGAIVALSDLSLLGTHSAATRANLLGFLFGDAQFSELLDADSVSTVSNLADPQDFAKNIMRHFDAKGLSGVFDTAKSTLEGVFVEGMHVGSAVRSAGYVYTTCDPSLNLRFGTQRRAMTLEQSDTSSAICYCRDEAKLVSPTYRRSPSYFEEVFVLGHDTDPFMSAPTKVMHVGLNAKSFVIGAVDTKGRSLTGGMVLGYDGAFLGLCGPRSQTTATGLGHVCWPLPADRPAARGSREILESCFKFLNFKAWPADLVEEVVVHSSVGKYASGRVFNAGCKPLANVGDSVLKTLQWTAMREAAIPHPKWQVVLQGLQNNVVMAEAAWKHGYAKALVVGPGVEMPRGSKAYADLTEALVGAASLVEKPEVVRQLAVHLQLVMAPDPGTPVAETFVGPGKPRRVVTALPVSEVEYLDKLKEYAGELADS